MFTLIIKKNNYKSIQKALNMYSVKLYSYIVNYIKLNFRSHYLKIIRKKTTNMITVN